MDHELYQMSPANKSNKEVKRGKTITIEIDSEVSDIKIDDGEMSPAFKNNLNFKRAAAKMPAVGNETKWPRKDNAFMGK